MGEISLWLGESLLGEIFPGGEGRGVEQIFGMWEQIPWIPLVVKTLLLIFPTNFFYDFFYHLQIFSFDLYLSLTQTLNIIFYFFGNLHHQLNFVIVFELMTVNTKRFLKCQFLLFPYPDSVSFGYLSPISRLFDKENLENQQLIQTWVN